MEDHSAAIDDIFADAISAAPASPEVSSSTGIAQAKPAAAGPAANDQFDVFEELERELAELDDIPDVTSPSLSSSTAAPLALQFQSPSTKTELGIDDQLDALLSSPSGPSFASTARPQLAVPSAAAASLASSTAAAASADSAVDVTVSGARASTAAAPVLSAAATPGPPLPHTPARSTATSARAAPVNPLEVAQTTVAMPLPPALAPKALTAPTAWPAEKLAQLERALGGSTASGGREAAGTPSDAAAVASLCIQYRSIPPRHRAAVWTTLLSGLSGPAAAPTATRVEQASASGEVTGVLGEATHAAEAHWEDATSLQQRICKDISKIASAGGGGGSEPGLCLSAESLSRVVQSFCTTRMIQYHVHLAALAAPLGYVTADPSTAFILLYNIVQTLFPAYFSSLPGSGAASSLLSSDAHPHDGGHRQSTSPAQAQAMQLGKALHALVQYHEPELALALDAACEGWWRPVGVGNGAVPPAWFHSLFSGSAGIRPTALLALWDRIILAAYVSARQSKAQGGSAASPSLDAQAWPLSPVGHAVVACAASLVIRESVGLRVVCRTVGVGSSSATSAAVDTSGLSVKERIKQQEAAAAGSKGGGEAGSASTAGSVVGVGAGMPTAGPEQARALMCNSLDAALKKVLKPATASGAGAAGKKKDSKGAGSEESSSAETGEEDLYVNSAHTWLASASSLLSSTPQSFGVHAGVDEGAPTADPTAPGGCGALLLSPAEILPQVVYGWQRVLSAVGAVPPSVRTAALQPNTRTALIPTPTLPIRPVHVMVLDVRPCSHRLAGRLATAYHIDPASLHVPLDSLPALVAAQGGKEAVERIEDEAAGASGVSVLGSPTGSHLADSGIGGLDSRGGEGSSVARSITSVTGDEAHASAWGVRGVPLATALTELKSLNGRLHFVVCGVGARTIRGAYPPTQLAACAALDDARVACAVRALAGAGFKWVSVLEGGFGAVHGGVRNKAMHAPPLLPALRPDGSYTSALTSGLPPASAAPSMTPSKAPQEGEAAAAVAGGDASSSAPAPAPAPAPASDVYDISLFVPVESAVSSLKACLVDHAPRACPACRHAAVVKLFDKMMNLSAPQGASGAAGGAAGGSAKQHGEGLFSSLWTTGAGGARTAPANLQDVAKAAATLFDGLADSAAAAVQRLQADLGVEPVTLQLPALRVPGPLPLTTASTEAGPSLSAQTPAGASAEGSAGENSSSPSSSLSPALAGVGANVALMGSGVSAATDAALTSILAAVRSGGVTAREGLATLAKDIAAAAERTRLARAQVSTGTGGTDSKTATGAGETQASSPKQGTSRDVAATFDSGLASSPGTGGGGDAFGIDGEDDEDEDGVEGVGPGDRPGADGGAAAKVADSAGKRTGVQRVKELRDQAAASAEQQVDKMMGQLEKSKEAAAVQAARAREQANKTKDQALAAAQTAKSVISRALAPPPASNPSAAPATMLLPSTAGSVFAGSPSSSQAPAATQPGTTTAQAPTSSAPAVAVSSALASVFAGIVTAPPSSSAAAAAAVPAAAARVGSGDSTNTSQPPSSAAPRFGLGNFGALAGGFSTLTGKAAEGLKQVTAAAEAGVALAQAKAAAVAATATAASTTTPAPSTAPAPTPAKAAPAPAPVSLPSMDPTSARLLAGTAKGEEFDPTDARWASSAQQGESGLMMWKCSKEKTEGGEDGAGLSSAARLLPRTLVLAPTAGRLLVCEADPVRGPGSGVYRVKSNHHVMELGKLSYSKKTPNRITLWYRRAAGESSAAASSSESAPPSVPPVTLVPRCYILEGAQAKADGSIVPNGEAFAMALQATVAKMKSG